MFVDHLINFAVIQNFSIIKITPFFSLLQIASFFDVSCVVAIGQVAKMVDNTVEFIFERWNLMSLGKFGKILLFF